ncbi:MAG: cytochrome b [Pseudomonadota bacterium]
MTNNAVRYTKTAVILHWLIAIVIFGMFALGWFMTDLPKEGAKQMSYDVFNWGIYTWQLAEEASPRTFYFNLHKSLGITLFGLIILRILWRITHKPPVLLNHKNWERKLAAGTHHLLYLLMIAMPISGLITAVSSKYGVKWFGIPFLKGLDNPDLRDIFESAHETIAIIILVVVILHIAGALKHKFIDKDDTLKRMSL